MRQYKKSFSYKDKYTVVSELLNGQTGSLLDVGSRDRKLKELIDPSLIEYQSADLVGQHDYIINLEKPLEIDDREFDFVAALDVLEHLENVHEAFSELLRITQKMTIIALPNMASFQHRWSYFWKGHLATGKYDLLPQHQGDRHRWLTTYPQINRFIEINAARHGFILKQVVEEAEGTYMSGIIHRLCYLCLKIGLPFNSFLVGRVIYVLERQDKIDAKNLANY